MRETLFRGKRKDHGSWAEGFHVMYSTSIGYPYSYTNGKHYIQTVPHNIQYEVDPETICQYTNSIALGGDKIFEHDIVEEDGAIGIVKFGKYGNGFHIGYYIDWINFPHLRNELHFWEGRVRIIGNIFDNPELVEGKSK